MDIYIIYLTGQFRRDITKEMFSKYNFVVQSKKTIGSLFFDRIVYIVKKKN